MRTKLLKEKRGLLVRRIGEEKNRQRNESESKTHKKNQHIFKVLLFSLYRTLMEKSIQALSTKIVIEKKVPCAKASKKNKTKMSSREEFMRSLGISTNDLSNPDKLASQAQERAEQRNALRAQKNPNAAAPAPSTAARKAPSSVAASSSLSDDVPASAQRNVSYSQKPDTEVPIARRSNYVSSSAAASAAAFMSGEPISRASAAPSASSSSSAGGSAASRAEFLRSMGIDNSGGEGIVGDLSKTNVQQQQQQPRGSQASSIRDTLRRTEQNAHEEEADSPVGARAHYGPRGSAAGASATPLHQTSSSSSSSAAHAAAALRRDAPSPAVGAGLDSSFSRMERQNSASTRRGSSSVNASANSGRLDASLNGSTSGAAAGAVPLLDVAGNEVPLDATADDYKKHGNAFYEQGDFRKAVRFYSRAIEKAPHNEVLYSNRSAGYLLASKQMAIDTRAMALRDADKCIELKPNWFKGYSRRGDALFKLERFDEACDAYRAALERDPTNAAIQASLEQCKACTLPKKDTSFAWSQPSDPYTSTSRAAGGAGAGGGAAGESSRRGAGSGSGSLNNSKSSYEMVEEFRVAAQRATGSSGLNAADYRERELEKFRQQRGGTSSGGNSGSGMKTSTASGGSDSLNNTTTATNNHVNDSPMFSSSRSAPTLDTYQSAGDAAAYQQSLLESYRRKKMMQQQGF